MQDVSIGVCIYGYMDTLIFRGTLIYEILHGNEHTDVSIGVWVYGYIDTLIDRDTLIGAPIHRYAGCVYRCMDKLQFYKLTSLQVLQAYKLFTGYRVTDLQAYRFYRLTGI